MYKPANYLLKQWESISMSNCKTSDYYFNYLLPLISNERESVALKKQLILDEVHNILKKRLFSQEEMCDTYDGLMAQLEYKRMIRAKSTSYLYTLLDILKHVEQFERVEALGKFRGK